MKFLGGILLFCAFGEIFATSCVNPEITSVGYTTQDATIVVNIAFVSEFSLKCANGVTDIPLHAEMNGVLLPVVRLAKDKYQVSWSEEIGKASSGDHIVNLYDDEGFGVLRKAMRNSEYTSSVKPLANVIVNHPGTYRGPWVNSEFIAAVVAISVWWMAFTAKSKLLS